MFVRIRDERIMLSVSSTLSTNKVGRTIKNNRTKRINIDTVVFTIQTESIADIYQSDTENQVGTVKISYLDEDLWAVDVGYEVDQTDE